MKQKRLILQTASVLLLSFCVLSAGMLHIFASDLPDKTLEGESFSPDVQPTPKNDGTVSEEGTDTPALDSTVLLTQEQLAEKFGIYTHVSEQDGKRVVTLFSEAQIAELNARRDGGELMLLTGQELLYLLDDTKRLFENYDVVQIHDPDGAWHTYPGLSFYSSPEFDAAFSASVGNVANELSYDLKKDTYEAMIHRIRTLHSYAEYIRYRPEIACMYVYTEWDGFEGEDPRVLAEGLVDRHATYSGRFTVAKNYAEGDRGDDHGAHPDIPQIRLNYIRQTPGAMLAFYGEEIFYIDDLSAFDGTNMIKLYPNGIFPGGTVTGKYENASGRAVVIEVWEEASGNCMARICLDEESDAAHVQKIGELWNGIKSIRVRGGEKLGAVGPGSYRVAVYLCGFPHQLQEGGSEQACFWYKPEADPDLWSLIWWDDPMLFFSDNFVGATDMTTYINRILQEKFAQ